VVHGFHFMYPMEYNDPKAKKHISTFITNCNVTAFYIYIHVIMYIYHPKELGTLYLTK